MRILFILMFISFLSSDAFAQPTVLQGGITKQETIKPVPNNLRSGQTFDERSFSGKAVDNWVPIPAWIAGRWVKTSETVIMNDGSRTTNQITSTAFWGSQTDRLGIIWHCTRMPQVGRGAGEGALFYSVWQKQEYAPLNNSYVRYGGEGYSITVNASTGTIHSTYQCRSEKQLTPNPDGSLTATSMEAKYDEQGRKQIEFRGLTHYYKTEAYQPDPTRLASFVAFLKARGMDDRVPDSNIGP